MDVTIQLPSRQLGLPTGATQRKPETLFGHSVTTPEGQEAFLWRLCVSECVWPNGLSQKLRKGYFLIRDSHSLQDASSPAHYPPRSRHKILERGGAKGREGTDGYGLLVLHHL